jgi:hypothetical protein
LADTPDWLDYGKMAAILELLCELVGRLDNATLSTATAMTAASDHRDRGDTVADPSLALEIETLQAALGPLLGRVGSPPLRSRADVNRLAEQLRMVLRI